MWRVMMGNMDSSHVQEQERRVGLLGHYWFLTFENAPELRSLAERCQQALDADSFYPVHPDGLHLTLDRIVYDGQSSPEQLESVERAARSAGRYQKPFTVTVERLADLRGALGFAVVPAEPVRALRDTLRMATRAVFPDAPVKDSLSEPHITIAYPLGGDLSAEAAAIAARTNPTIERVAVAVTEAVMVALERHDHSYSWKITARIPLTTSTVH